MTKKLYPSNERIQLDGGLNNKFARVAIAENESPDCLNVEFTDGAVETRGGSSKLNTIAVGSYVIDGLHTRRNDAGSETMIVFAGGLGYTLGATTFSTIPSAQSVWTAGVRVGSTQYQNQIFFGNGTQPYKYNGTDWTRHGVEQPNSTPTATSNATGPLTGEYRYKVSYLNSYSVEGDVSTFTATLTAASATIRLTSIPVAPQSFGVAERRIYRTVSSGVTFLRLTTLSDNTTTTYDDSTADADLGAAAPTDNGSPPNWSTAVYHQSRLFMNDTANPSYVWYTEIAEPHTVASTNFIRVGDASTDIVKNLTVYQNSVLVVCENSMWLIYMPDTTASNWILIRTKTQFGTESPYGAVLVKNGVLVPVTDTYKFMGFALVQGDQVRPTVELSLAGATGTELESTRIESDMFTVPEGNPLDDITGIVYKNKAWFAMPYGSGQTTNNRIYTYDFTIENVAKDGRPAWVPFTGMNARDFTIYNNNLYFGTSDATGFVYQADTDTYNDDGSAIDSYVWTKEFQGYVKDSQFFKDWRQINIMIKRAGAWTMDFRVRVDSDDSGGNAFPIDLTPDTSTWNNFNWGEAAWGAESQEFEITKYLGQTQGRRIQFKFGNNNVANQYFKIYNFNFAYTVRGIR